MTIVALTFVNLELAELVVAVIGVALAGLTAWPTVHRWLKRRSAPATTAVVSLVAPTGEARTVLRGRAAEMSLLRKAVRRPGGRFVVLAGLGGVGKSAIASKLCEWRMQATLRSVWWVSARTPETFTEGLVAVAEKLGGTSADSAGIRAGTGHAQDRFWRLLSRARRGWLLVFDDADDVGVLGPLNGSGWVRPSRRGLVLLTSRVGSHRVWGDAAVVIDVSPLGEANAARMLLDLAPAGGTEHEARSLARRLAGLPLALNMAGRGLGWEFARWSSFRAYVDELNADGIGEVAEPDDGMGTASDPRRTVMSTYELSLDSLAGKGISQARPLLRLLSCFASTVAIPVSVLEHGSEYDKPQLIAGLRGLARLSLVTELNWPIGGVPVKAVSLHPLVAETNRIHLQLEGVASCRATHRLAVELMSAAVEPVRFDDNARWPIGHALIPHARQMLESTVPHLDEADLARLLNAVGRLVAVAVWSGSERDGERLAVDALNRVGPLRNDHPGYPACLRLRTELAWATGRHGNWHAAHDALGSVLDAWSAVPDAPEESVLDVRHKLAWATGKTGDWESAYQELTAVRGLRARMLGDDHPDTLHTRCCLSWAAWRISHTGEAEAGYLSVIEARRRVLGDDHIETLDARHSLGEGYVLEGRHAEAEAVLREVISDYDRVLGPQHPETLEVRPRYWLGQALRRQGRHLEADTVLSDLLARQTEALGRDHPATVATRTSRLWEEGHD
ncbi:tetratricopeptide repeat protein [Allorhizocola rhizosphaerae]|uniref:tetratricopeptide repeat protein n=1 Tax=Allorhizocola rhizosphaerae TaxID=1872709 RepID=UPI0013C311B5|nr:tetratricopeptide repeat protein [Allorhizocola rhizosphaerae]